jgi:hypothetical protein
VDWQFDRSTLHRDTVEFEQRLCGANIDRAARDYGFLNVILHECCVRGSSGNFCMAWFQVFCSGILGNWLVGCVALFATQARTLYGKFIGTLIPVLTFTAIGVQHSTSNMGILMNGMIFNGIYGFDRPLNYGWGDVFAYNIVPASIGNVIGATVLVVLLFTFAFRRLKPGEKSSWLFRDPVEMPCAVCEAENGKEMRTPASKLRRRARSPLQVRENPFSNITLAEGWGDTLVDKRSEEEHDEMSSAVTGDSPIRASAIAEAARRYADNLVMEQEYEGQTCTL